MPAKGRSRIVYGQYHSGTRDQSANTWKGHAKDEPAGLNKTFVSSSFRPKLIEDEQNPAERNSGIWNLDDVLCSIMQDTRADSDGNEAMFVNVLSDLGGGRGIEWWRDCVQTA